MLLLDHLSNGLLPQLEGFELGLRAQHAPSQIRGLRICYKGLRETLTALAKQHGWPDPQPRMEKWYKEHGVQWLGPGVQLVLEKMLDCAEPQYVTFFFLY